MANYVCASVDNANNCLQWVEYQSALDSLAITPSQASELMLGFLVAVITAYGIRQVMNVILQRRY